MNYLGDYAKDYATLNFKFTTRAATGVPATLTGGVVKVYKGSATDSETTTGVTLAVNFDGVTGLNNVLIDLSADAFYAVANDYAVVITTGTVGGVSVVGEVVATFSIENRSKAVLANAAHGGAAATLTLLTPVEANAVQISGDGPAADRLESEFDGTAAAARGAIYVSKSGNDGNDGRSWQTAKLTVTAAVAAAAAGATIRIGPGTYIEVVDASAKANLTFEGTGWGTIIAPAAGVALTLGEQGIVRNLALVGVANGLYAHNISRVRAERCYISSSGDHACLIHDVMGVTIEDCYILGTTDGIMADSCGDVVVRRSTVCGKRYGITSGVPADGAGAPNLLRVEHCTVYCAGYTADYETVAVKASIGMRLLVLDSDLKVSLPAGAVDPWQAFAVQAKLGVISRSRLYAESQNAGGEAYGVWTDGGKDLLVHACSIQTVCAGTALDLAATGGGTIGVCGTKYSTTKTIGTITQAPTDTSIAGYTSARATKIDNLDATVGSRATQTSADAIKAKTDLIPAIPASQGDVTTAAGQIRGGTRTLEDLATPNNIPTPTANAAKAAEVLAAAHGAGSWEGIAERDWTDPERKQIRDVLGVAGDKVTAAGGQVQAIKVKTDTIGSVAVTYTTPAVTPGGPWEIHCGSAYLAAAGRAIDLTITGYGGPSLIGAAGALRLLARHKWAADRAAAADMEVVADVSQVGTTVVLSADLSAAATAALEPSPPRDVENYRVQFWVTPDGGEPFVLGEGDLTAKKGIAAV